jgi:BirA family transcriptional regulator, biotin operon repressor / biotin---[acetyl-CoA-carboxylase] ligase
MTADAFDLRILNDSLARTRFAGKLHHFATIGSTSTHAMAQAEVGAPDGEVYFADEQTAGRGRGAHSWSSPTGTGLYFSVLLRPRLSPGDALWFSLAAGLAVHAAVERVTTLRADIRWPNDLLLGRHKFCGILTEMNAEVTRVRHLVIGIGINVRQPEFPEDIRRIATSLRIETGRDWSRQDVLAAVLTELEAEIAALSSPSGIEQATASILKRLEKSSSWIRGKRVFVEGMEGYEGVTEGLDQRGFLRIRTAQGLKTVLSGGVREQKGS